MYKNLAPGAIGIHNQDTAQTIAVALKMGFPGIDINIRELQRLAEAQGLDHCRNLFLESGIRPGNWITPDDWKSDEPRWQQMIADIPALAALSQAVGCTRASTYFASGSDERDYAENFEWHARRLRPIATILRDHGIAFGMEFMGPLTVRQGKRYEFIHNVAGQMELARHIGTGNVGLLLDAWHLYTSGDSLDVLSTLTAKDVVNVHVCDAPRGLTMETYQDMERCLPMETGVIDLPGFIRALERRGYDGPVTPEPFNAPLNAITANDPDRACAVMSDCMQRLWIAAGLTDQQTAS